MGYPFATEVTRRDTEVYFSALPGVLITPETRDIPFKPEIIYANLPGARLTTALGSAADQIIFLVETCQRAINAEDLDLYMSIIAKENPGFYEMAKAGAKAQFIDTDMKRYTTKVDFLSVSQDAAEVAVTFEAFIFPARKPDRSGAIFVSATQHMEITFNWQLKKLAGRWKVTGTALGGSRARSSCADRLMLFVTLGIPALGFLIGLAVACWALFGGPISDAYKSLTGGPRETYEKGTVEGTPITIEKEFYTSEPMVMYDEPDKGPGPSYYIKPYERVKVISTDGGWTKVRVEGEGYGYIPTAELPPGVSGVIETADDFVAVDSGIVIYEKPDFSENPKYVIMPGVRVKVVKRSGGWAYVQTDDGQAGWTPAVMLPD